jgi:hypothetical protein
MFEGILRDYLNIPAHIMHVEVLDVVDSEGDQVGPVWKEFQGTRPIVRAIDLREIDTVVKDYESERNATDPGISTGKENEDNLKQKADNEDKMEEEGAESLDTVRFQYDGVLEMDVIIERPSDRFDEKKCEASDFENPVNYKSLVAYGNAQSFHVIDYLTAFLVDVSLGHNILGKICEIVDDELKILVSNNVGVDQFAGSVLFEEKAKNNLGDDYTLLEQCSPIKDGACLFNVTHDKDGETGQNKGNAGLKGLQLATGRPNIVYPYTKSIIFKVINGNSDVEHKAAVFVSGLYSKGPGNSFSLPTHEPIMILRDPRKFRYLAISFILG